VDATSTCFLVRRAAPDTAYYLITAAHALEQTKGETVILVLRKAMPDGSYQRHDYSIPVRREGKPLWVRHAKQDVAVLRLADPLSVAVAALPASVLADEDRMKSEYEERLVRHPLGLGTILHAQYVRETLDAAARQNEPSSK